MCGKGMGQGWRRVSSCARATLLHPHLHSNAHMAAHPLDDTSTPLFRTSVCDVEEVEEFGHQRPHVRLLGQKGARGKQHKEEMEGVT